MSLLVSIEGMVLVPARDFTSRDKKALTLNVFDIAERTTTEHEAFVDLGAEVAVPLVYAKTRYRKTYKTTLGFETSTPKFPELRPNQMTPVGETIDLFGLFNGLTLQAYTGSGKTVMGCYVAAKLRLSTLILVDQEKLMDQWVDTLVTHFGYRRDQIGTLRGDTVDFAHDFTIGMVQSVYNSVYDDDLYQAFGMVMFDEAQVCGAEQFSNVLGMFPSQYRLALSATPDRKDALGALLKLHIEEKRVVLEEDRATSRVYVVEHDSCHSWYANVSPKTGRFISEVCEDNRRNLKILDAIREMYADPKRHILVIGERIAQLESLYALAALSGLPEDDMLMYCGQESQFKYHKNPKPSGDPKGWEPGTLYTPVHLEAKQRKANLRQKSSLLHERRIIFSTYSVFSKGVDVPELDTGIDVTPKTSFVQTHGRILRKRDRKRIPIWVTMLDTDSFRAQHQFSKRLAELVSSKAEVFLWKPDKGTKAKLDPRAAIRAAERRAKQLRNVRISIDSGGNYTPLTRPIGSVSGNGSDNGTVNLVRRISRRPNSAKASSRTGKLVKSS